MAARFGVALTGVALLCAVPAAAQQYQRLHVRSFVLSSDAARVQPEQPFHVSAVVRVSENVARLDNLYLPTFFGAEELGDEQQILHAPSGTTYRETLTLVAHGGSSLAITPAYLDAIDARDGKPKRFISNSLQLRVGSGMARRSTFLRVVAFVVIVVVLLAGVPAAIVAVAFRRRTAPVHAMEVPAEAPPRVDDVEAAFDRLRMRRDRGSLLQLRGALWRRAGAQNGETLADVLRRPAATDPQLRKHLFNVERAAFVEESRFEEVLDEVLSGKT